MEANFEWAKQCKEAAHKARRELLRLRSVLTCRKPEVFVPLYKAFVRPHLQYWIQAWSPYLKKDIACLEKVQRLATRTIEGQMEKHTSKGFKT